MAQVPKVRLSGGLEICRILNGMWQVSDYGLMDKADAVQAMQAYMDAGLTTFDMADHYGPAEDIYGTFYKQSIEDSRPVPQGLTKWVPQPGPMDRKVVEAAVRRSLSRMQVDKLDCVQFHWWDYKDQRYLDALGHLADLQQEGLIGELSLTNFDTQRLEEITNKGFRISSNQVQYSLIDQRPAAKMADFCLSNNIQLLTYGTLGGGLLSERYLGAAEPQGWRELRTPSLRKYKHMVDCWGGWPLFQELLVALDAVARQRGCSIATVATRYVLERPAVGGVIVGCRLGASEHIEDSVRSCCSPELTLSAEELRRLDAVLSRATDLLQRIGDCGDEYRRRE